VNIVHNEWNVGAATFVIQSTRLYATIHLVYRNGLVRRRRRLSQFFKPLLGCTRSRGRCWAAIRLSSLSATDGN